VMQRRGKSRMWANDDVMPDGADKSARRAAFQPPGKPAKAEKKTKGETVRRAAAKSRATEEDSESETEHVDDAEEEEEEREEEAVGTAGSDSDGEKNAEPASAAGGLSDMDYLRSKVVSDFNFDSSDSEDEGGEAPLGPMEAASSSDDEDAGAGGNRNDSDAEGDSAPAEQEDEEAAGPRGGEHEEGGIGETGRLFLRNLPYTATEDDLRELFSPYGELSDVHLVLDRDTRKSKGIAYIMYMMPEDAVRAATELDATDFQGRLLHILPAKLPPHSKTAAERGASTSYKQEKEEDRKSQAGNRATWNSLFMRQDTVAEAIAAHFGVSKSELLDRDTADLPVRMALGETHVIASTKKALGDAGVAVGALEAAAAAGGHAAATKSVARSSTCLLVKNLPYAVTAEELSDMFEAMGALARLVLPPTRTLALVEYLEAQDAKRAFRGLAYKRCHHVPLYLEWAPEGIFAPDAPTLQSQPVAKRKEADDEPDEAAAVHDSTVVAGLVDAENDAAGAEGVVRELYVKNLNFETRDAALRAHFAAAAASAGGRVTAARVATKPAPASKTGGKAKGVLSLGFGFVELDSEATARAVLRARQGSKLDGHSLVLQLARAGGGSAPHGGKTSKSAPDESRTKLMVRNVAFETTRKELSSLFGAVGQLKSLRLPKKFDGTHRGFAFVEFATQQETQAAIDTVSGTHLYGRRLLVERAKEEDGLEDIRGKTAAKFHDSDGPQAKRRKVKGSLMADLEAM